MIRALLVDDEPPARARLRQLLAEHTDVLVIGEAGDAEEARAAIALAKPDVVFLDIDMPEMSGTTLAAALPDPRPLIVFATAFDRYALNAFEVDATDFLVKPITRARLSATLARVGDRLRRRSDLEREMIAASATQAHLIRELPLIPGFDCAAITIPARGVGGDFYLARALGPGRFSFAVGDVSGKGMPAGLVASSLQARIETLSRHSAAAAAAVVADINAELCETTDGARYATLVYLQVDASTGEMRIVNAGHCDAIVLERSGSRYAVRSTGPAVGMMPDAAFGEQSLTMCAGDRLVLYSDGVIESLDASDDEFGEARLIRVLEATAAESARDTCRAVIDAVHAHRGTAAPRDDMTVMIIKRAA